MMIVAELRELLARDEEGRLPVGQPFLGFRQLQRGFAHLLERVAHRATNPLRTLGYS